MLRPSIWTLAMLNLTMFSVTVSPTSCGGRATRCRPKPLSRNAVSNAAVAFCRVSMLASERTNGISTRAVSASPSGFSPVTLKPLIANTGDGAADGMVAPGAWAQAAALAAIVNVSRPSRMRLLLRERGAPNPVTILFLAFVRMSSGLSHRTGRPVTLAALLVGTVAGFGKHADYQWIARAGQRQPIELDELRNGDRPPGLSAVAGEPRLAAAQVQYFARRRDFDVTVANEDEQAFLTVRNPVARKQLGRHGDGVRPRAVD